MSKMMSNGFPAAPASRAVPALLASYVRVALRKVRRQKAYAAINVAGLGVGLACCILMMLWIRHETSFDRFHAAGDSIYRIVTETRNENAATLDARAPTPLGPAMKAGVPEVLDFCRFRTNPTYGIRVGDKAFFDELIGIAEPSFFTMFSFPLVQGDPRTALDNPDSVVVTEDLARRLFGGADPMGKTVNVALDPFTVTGVMRDVPVNSHMRFTCVIPVVKMARYHHVDFANWNSMFFNCYVRMAPGADPGAATSKIVALLRREGRKANLAVRLQPLKDVHLKSDFAFDMDNRSQGSAAALTLFAIAAAAILLLACVNFMNLATARSVDRAKEIGLRKVVGARRADIVRQLLGESVVMAALGLGTALLVLWAILPSFNRLAERALTLAPLARPGVLATVLGITVAAGLLAGSYPASSMAVFAPVRALKASFFGGGRDRAALRKALVLAQFAVTIFFVTGTIIVDRQLRFVRSRNLGVDTHQVVTFPVRSGEMAQAMLKHSGVLAATMGTPPVFPMRAAVDVTWEGRNPADRTPFFPVAVDPEYLDVFRARMSEGRFFSRDRESDRTGVAVVNETAARAMGGGSPLGKRVTITAMNNEGRIEPKTYAVIGVMKDFHADTLRRTIEPKVFTPDDGGPYISLRLSAADLAGTMKFLESTWKEFVRDYPFKFEFLDDRIDAFYKQDRRTRAILGVFAILALFTSCLGLIGLSSFVAERKTKEIGIRRVLGASVRGLVLLQSREFLLWVLAANAVAAPAAYLAAAQWLRGFAYRVSPGMTPALWTAGFSLAIAFASVAFQAVRAASARPIDALKYE